MKSTKFLLSALLMAAMVFFYACGGSTETPGTEEGDQAQTEQTTVSEASLLLDHFEANNNPITAPADKGGFPQFISATELNDELGGYTAILDLRSAFDFAGGHIDGAINVKPEDFVRFMEEDFNPDGWDKVVLVCYSGQMASYMAGLLDLMGVPNVYVLKWGMSSWNKKFSHKWEDAQGDNADIQLETTDNPMGAAGELPTTLATGKETGEEIATAQATKLIEAGFKPARVKMEEINLGDYYIVSIVKKEDYDLGHLPGAVWYNPDETMGKDMKLNTLPTDKPILVYCYSGQNAAFTVAYLRMLGYDAYSLLYGANHFMHSKLVEGGNGAFKPEYVNDFEFIETEFQGDAGAGGGGC